MYLSFKWLLVTNRHLSSCKLIRDVNVNQRPCDRRLCNLDTGPPIKIIGQFVVPFRGDDLLIGTRSNSGFFHRGQDTDKKIAINLQLLKANSR